MRAKARGHSRPRRATPGTPVCTCPGRTTCSGSTRLRRARARAPGSGLGGSRLCSRPREAHFDGSRSRLAGGQSVRAPCFPRPLGTPEHRPSVCSRGPGLRFSSALWGAAPWAACSAIAGPRSRPVCVLASSRSSLPALRPLLGVPGRRRRSPVYQRGRARGSIWQGNGRGFGARRSYSYPVRYRRYHNPDCFREGEGRKGAAELFVPKSV